MQPQQPGPPQAAPYYPPPPTPQRRTGCLFVIGCLLALSLVVNFMLVVLLGANNQSTQNKAKLFKEKTIKGKGKSKIAVIRVRGTIMESGNYNDTATARMLIPMLTQAQKDKDVKGVIIDANSPGGSVTASDQIHKAMVKLRKAKKPVVFLMGDTCASGCVYISASANKIIAHPTSVTGSIGVIISTLNFSKFLQQYGIQGVTIASKKNKALLSPFEPVQEEHKAILKSIVDEMYQRFVNIMSRWRKIPKATMLGIADGRVFSASKALQYKLIDQIGYGADARTSILKLTGLSKARFVRYRREVSFFDIFQGYAQMPQRLESKQRVSLNTFLELQTPRAYFLWHPTSPTTR